MTYKILVIGASGMLGSSIFRFLSQFSSYEVWGSVRSSDSSLLFPKAMRSRIVSGVDVESSDSLIGLFSSVKPTLVINCVGLVKQLSVSKNALAAIPINSLLPHRLASMCEMVNARLIHFSTDCVFSGYRGMYTEGDIPDAQDMYGRSKLLGEVDYPHAITLRTSIIGHELSGARSLVGWFLSQQGAVKGYRRAIFSGLPTVEIARLIHNHVIPHPEISGLYHVSAEPINKFDLLEIVAKVYQKDIEILPDDHLLIDRSLDSTRFRNATGFQPAPWQDLVQAMHDFH
ncbi:SDR family oxidoreductase [Comamonas sp. Z3]|uniref:dTDP-4-dehydrorhamnose reductase family protein n=1 Tax=Comamonas sp. Z3 TaxID=2601247 RepID=UPI0011E712A3|nr:SDR family oxidoreductase [Comamonas sp. Z3]TYK70586.1 SDR family oxidoreductase [Comamonas sp. Z3]